MSASHSLYVLICITVITVITVITNNNTSQIPLSHTRCETLLTDRLFQLDKGISYLAPMFLDYVICSGLSAELAAGLESCLPHTTTSTTDRTGRVSSVASRQGSGLLLLAVLLASEMFQSSPSSAQDI